jgi:hypothetical protein
VDTDEFELIEKEKKESPDNQDNTDFEVIDKKENDS